MYCSIFVYSHCIQSEELVSDAADKKHKKHKHHHARADAEDVCIIRSWAVLIHDPFQTEELVSDVADKIDSDDTH